MGGEQIKQQAQQRHAKAKAQLAVNRPQGAGVRQRVVVGLKKCAALSGAAAQAAAKPPSGQRPASVRAAEPGGDLRQYAYSQRLKQTAGDDQRARADVIESFTGQHDRQSRRQ